MPLSWRKPRAVWSFVLSMLFGQFFLAILVESTNCHSNAARKKTPRSLGKNGENDSTGRCLVFFLKVGHVFLCKRLLKHRGSLNAMASIVRWVAWAKGGAVAGSGFQCFPCFNMVHYLFCVCVFFKVGFCLLYVFAVGLFGLKNLDHFYCGGASWANRDKATTSVCFPPKRESISKDAKGTTPRLCFLFNDVLPCFTLLCVRT